jgi:hypothetical protein
MLTLRAKDDKATFSPFAAPKLSISGVLAVSRQFEACSGLRGAGIRGAASDPSR